MSARPLTPGEIKAARTMRGLTQRAAAQQIGVHYVTLGRIETGVHAPSPLTMRAIRAWLGLDSDGNEEG